MRLKLLVILLLLSAIFISTVTTTFSYTAFEDNIASGVLVSSY